MPNQNISIIQSSWGIGFKCKGDLRNVWNAPFFCFIFNQMNVAYQILVQMLSRRLLIYRLGYICMILWEVKQIKTIESIKLHLTR